MSAKASRDLTVVTSFTCPGWLFEKLGELAKKNRRSRSQQIVLLLEKAVNESEPPAKV